MIDSPYSSPLLEQTQDLFWVVDSQFCLVYANKAYLNVTKEVTGKEPKRNDYLFAEGLDNGYIVKWKTYYERGLNGEHFETEEHFYNPTTNQLEYSAISFKPIADENGVIVNLACQSRDITSIIKSNIEVEKILDASLDVICIADEKGNFVSVSAAATSLWGYSPCDLIGKAYQDFIVEEDVAKTLEVAKAIMSGQPTKTFMNRYRKKDGGIAYNFWSATWDENSKLMYAVARDGKEAIAQEEKLVRSELRFKALVQGGYDLYAITDLQGHYIYMSPSSTAIIGIPPEAFIGRDAFEFIHPDDLEQTLSSLKKVSTEGRVVMEPYRAKNQNNEWCWVESVLTNMLDNPDVNGIVINSRDITERIKQEEKIQLSNKRLEALVENSMDSVIIISPEGNTKYVSGSITNMLGYSQKEIMDIDFRDLVHPDDLPSAENALLRCINNPGITMKGSTSRVKHKNGSWRWIEAVITNLLHDPSVMGIVDNFRDITELVQEQERLKLLESVIINTNDAVLITEAQILDEPGPRILYVNEAFTKMTGYTAEEVLGKTPRILQGPNTDRNELAKLSKAICNYQPCEITTINYKKNGDEFWINFTVNPVANENGWYTHWVAIERDVTEQKNKALEKELITTISDIFHDSIDYDLTICLTNLSEHIIKFGDFDYAEIWLPSIDARRINRVANYSKGEAGSVYFQATKEITSCTIGKELPGHVWKNKKTEIWGNVEEKWLTKRKLAAKKAGFGALIGVPLTHKEEVIGVLCLGTIKTKLALTQYIDLFKKLELAIGSELSRKKIEIELAQIFDFTPDLICMAGFDGYIKKINPAGLALLGYSLEEMLAQPISAFLHEQDRLLTRDNQLKLYNGENLQNFENRYITKEGKVVWLSWTSTSSPEQGVVYAVAKNITEEKKLRELNRQVGKLAKIGSWEVDMVNDSVFWSDEVHQIYGTDPKYFVPTVDIGINLYRADYRPLALSSFERCISNQEPYAIEAVMVNRNNKEVWVQTTAKAEFVDGVCTRVYGSFQDIDDRKQSEIRLQSFSENLPGVVYQYIIHPDGTDSMQFISGMVEKLWGYTTNEVMQNIDLLWDQIRLGGDIEEVKSSIAKSIETKSKWTCRFKIINQTGEIKTHLGSGTPNFLADGTILFHVMVLDITQEAKNEELLEETTNMARVGSWELDMINQDGESIYWSPVLREIVEVEEGYDPTLTGGIEFHVGESKERIQKALDLLITDGVEFDEEILLRTAKGNERWNRCIGKREMVNGKLARIYGSYQDIHKRKESELELEKSLRSLEDYKYSLDQSAIIATTDNKGIITSVNDNFCKISKYEEEEIIGKTHRLINSKHHPKEFFKDLWKTIASGKVWRGEIRNKAKDNSYYWVDTTIVPFLDENNNPLQYLDIRFDITERKKAEQEKTSLQETIENSVNEIYTFDPETYQFTYVNRGALANLGYTEQEIKTLTPLDIKPDHTQTSFNQLIAPLRNNEKEKIIFFTNHKRKNGSLYPVEVHLQLVNDGNTKRFLAIVLDITERKKAESKLIESENYLRTILDNEPECVKVLNSKGELLSMNPAGLAMLEADDEQQVLGHLMADLLNKEYQFGFKRLTKEVFKGNSGTFEFEITGLKGRCRWLETHAVPLKDTTGKIVNLLAVTRDITERKKAEEKLLDINKKLSIQTNELQRSNEELEQFAFITSHDLQEPLRMISSFMDLLKRKYSDRLDEKGLQYIYYATDGAKRMKQIILDLLLYSRANKSIEQNELIDLNEIVSEFTQLRRKVITEQSATITNHGLPTIETYRAPITQIFHCLLDNALKYVHNNVSPRIEISVIEKDDVWQFAIKDNGVGIDQKFYDKIFIIFQRLQNRKEQDGTGIGLAIVKRSIEFLGGEIWVESEIEKGTAFYFSLPK